MLGLLVAVNTAASLVVRDVHGLTVVLVVMCAALAAGLAAIRQLGSKKSLSGLQVSRQCRRNVRKVGADCLARPIGAAPTHGWR